ncbi:MAG: phosphodiester glycosidase family protein, partial [Actinomycetota bacterium]
AAITGTYFCTASSLPVGLIKVRGKTIYRGGIGTALAFSPGKGAIIQTCKPGVGYDWSGYETVLRAGPRLVTNGQRTLFPEAEGFKDPAVFARKPRTAVAITHEGKLLFVAVQKPVLLRTLADALRKLGAKDAMCLDGGGSTALYYKGKTLVKPGRPLTNLLVAYDSRSRSRIYAGRLNPDGPRMVKTESNAG